MLMNKITENAEQSNIRINLEKTIEDEVLELYIYVVALNHIHNDILLGDRRKKKNIKLEKHLKKYINSNKE